MLTYLVSFLLALAVAAATTPIVAALAHKFHFLDQPSEGRKIHTRALPRLGGIAVVLAFFAPLVGLYIYTNEISQLLYADLRLVTALLLGTAVIVGLGIFDDLKGAGAPLKFTVQGIVAVGMWLAGFRIDLVSTPFGGEFLHLGSLSLPITVLWIVGVVNALNLIDGLDGLATGVALFAALVLFGVSFVDNAILLCLICTSLLGALLGFLFFNFNPAKIFLGDSGSMFLGFLLASISVWTQRKGPTAVALLIPVIALGLPLLDTTLSVVRRLGKGQNPFKADREHVHHRLLALGLSHRAAVITLYTVSAAFSLGALALLDNDTTHRTIALSTVVAVAVILVRKVRVFAPLLSSTAAVRDEIRAVAREIRSSPSVDTAWRALTDLLPRLDCEEVQLSLALGNGEVDQTNVLKWCGRTNGAAQHSVLDKGTGPDHRILRLRLEEGEARFGDLLVLLGAHAKARREDQELAFELLRDAFIDWYVARNGVAPGRDLRVRKPSANPEPRTQEAPGYRLQATVRPEV